VIDRDFRVLVVNRAYLALTERAGYSVDPLGMNLFKAYPFLSQKVREEYDQVFEIGEHLKTEEKNTLYGVDFFTETQKIPIFENKKVVRVMTVIRDITEWKRADEFKSNLIAFASHELKTPLVPILGWASYIKKVLDAGEDLNDNVEREDVLSIIRNAERLKAIVDSYMDVGRIEAGRLELSLEEINILHVLTGAISAVSHMVKENHDDVQIDVPNISLFGDSFRLEQVFVNILSNAFKYSPPNTRVRVYAEDLGDRVKVSVQDEGSGFSRLEIAEAFQPFSRSFQKTKKQVSGSGVGLYICRRIVEAHHGNIEIRSPGRNLGTTVSVTLSKDPRAFVASK
jgi:two-component system sensor histidine kinase VicK